MLVQKEVDPEEVKRLKEVEEKKKEVVSVLCLLTHCELTFRFLFCRPNTSQFAGERTEGERWSSEGKGSESQTKFVFSFSKMLSPPPWLILLLQEWKDDGTGAVYKDADGNKCNIKGDQICDNCNRAKDKHDKIPAKDPKSGDVYLCVSFLVFTVRRTSSISSNYQSTCRLFILATEHE
jgi:hypothetical protein